MVHLQVKNLSKTYVSSPVLRDLSFEFDGGVIGIAGPNGSGKSTLMRCLAGLTLPSSGEIKWHIDGEDFTHKTVASKLGYAAPYVQLYEELSTRENLAFIRDLRYSETCASIPELSSQFELEDFIDSLFGEISSGQQQRVKLAAANIHQPPVICLDEPGTNLDEAGHKIIQTMIRSCEQAGGLVLLASNQSRELDLCDHVVKVTD